MRQRIVLSLFLLTTLLEIIIWFYLRDLIIIRGEELYQISAQLTQVRGQNILLEEQILHFSSLTYLASEAARQGFVPATYHRFH
jgi:hypothetical protein